MTEKRVSMGAIALCAGVSRASVCRALKQDPRISKALTRKIEELAKTMGYRPDPVISKLARNRWGSDDTTPGTTIGYLCCHPEAREKRMPRYVSWLGIQATAASLGYHMITINYWGWRSMDRVVKLLSARNITGLIIGTVSSAKPELSLNWSRYSIVDQAPHFHPIPRFHRVRANPFDQLVLAVKKVVEYGYGRIGIILVFHQQGFDDDMQRYGALQSLLWQYSGAGSCLCTPLYLHRDVPVSVWADQVAAWFTKYKPDAVIGFTDLFQHMLKDKLGLLAPVDFGYCSLHRRADFEPVAGVNLTEQDEGAYAVRLLDIMLRSHETGIPTHPIQHFVEVNWVDGESMPPKGKTRSIPKTKPKVIANLSDSNLFIS